VTNTSIFLFNENIDYDMI